jgi:DnaK suppressor protein
MNLDTQTHLTTLRQLLDYRLHELRSEVDERQESGFEPVPAGTHEVVDRKDEAAQDQLAELAIAELRRDARELGQIRAALRRLDDGSYGDCLGCGEPIPLARLLVQPAAERCAACQAVHERGTRIALED